MNILNLVMIYVYADLSRATYGDMDKSENDHNYYDKLKKKNVLSLVLQSITKDLTFSYIMDLSSIHVLYKISKFLN